MADEPKVTEYQERRWENDPVKRETVCQSRYWDHVPTWHALLPIVLIGVGIFLLLRKKQ